MLRGRHVGGACDPSRVKIEIHSNGKTLVIAHRRSREYRDERELVVSGTVQAAFTDDAEDWFADLEAQSEWKAMVGPDNVWRVYTWIAEHYGIDPPERLPSEVPDLRSALLLADAARAIRASFPDRADEILSTLRIPSHLERGVLYSCPSCGSIAVQYESWIVANTGAEGGETAASHPYWCGSCETHPDSFCELSLSDGTCDGTDCVHKDRTDRRRQFDRKRSR